MHPYEASRSTRISSAVVTISFAIVWLLDSGITALGLELPSWATIPYVVLLLSAVYSIARYAFDIYIWKLALFRQLHLVKIPDLDGKWEGLLQSSYDAQKTSYPITLHIKQRWSKILIRLDTETSRSHSVSASLRTDMKFAELSYRYENKPKPSALTNMAAHDGTAVLELQGDELTGEYYTGRGRKQFGSMRVRRAK